MKNLSQQPYNLENRRASGAEYPEFRGLGPGTTVILLNGLPVAASSGDAADAFDLNSIPLTAVKEFRIALDPLPASSPAAVGGVVNVILDDNREQNVVDFRTRRPAAAPGSANSRPPVPPATAGGRIRGTLAVEYQQRDLLLGEKRDLWRNQDYRRFGGRDYRSSSSSPGNIRTLNGANLPGLSSPRAVIPVGNDDQVGVEDFAATAGETNYESLSRYYSLVPAIERGSVVGMVNASLSDRVTVAGEFLYAAREVTQQRNPPALAGILVPAANPFNPFGTPLVADLLLDGLPPQLATTDSELLRSVFSVRSRIGSWDGRLAVVDAHDRVSVASFTDVPRDRVTMALAATDPARSLNISKPGSLGTRELLQWLVDEPNASRSASDTILARAMLTGKIGKVDAQFGVDGERTHSSFAEIGQQVLRRHASAGFAEFLVPLHATLHLNVGARVDRLSDVGEMAGAQYSLKWRPFESLALVAAYGKSQRAPTLLEMMRPRMRGESTVVDSNRHGEVRRVDVIVGGNPELDPMRIDSWSLAVILKPESKSYELSAKYWDTLLQDQIIVPSLPWLFDHEGIFRRDRVVRDEPTAMDAAAGQPGSLRLL